MAAAAPWVLEAPLPSAMHQPPAPPRVRPPRVLGGTSHRRAPREPQRGRRLAGIATGQCLCQWAGVAVRHLRARSGSNVAGGPF
eukprot:15246611-Alexandrium_andersonii.AAC.1